MIREIRIENYKSIEKLKLELGRVTVLIGENGSGKSNILEAIALASAAASDKLDNEFLVSRGIEVTVPQYMRSGFDKENVSQDIKISLKSLKNLEFSFVVQNDNKPYSKWKLKAIQPFENPAEIREFLAKHFAEDEEISIHLLNQLFFKKIKQLNIGNFFIYSPEIQCLRTFTKEGQIQPLGIKGEGLFKLLNVLSLEETAEKLNEIKEKLRLIDCFRDFELPQSICDRENQLLIKDRYLDPQLGYLTQQSYSEGFLFVLFYLTLFISDDTPKFFAIDNIDASINPRLCRRLLKELIKLAEKYDKQVIFTAHNPNLLDGLNLDDEEQRLLVIYRNKLGHTKAIRILKPEPLKGQELVRLSEAFLRGYIGGLPKNF